MKKAKKYQIKIVDEEYTVHFVPNYNSGGMTNFDQRTISINDDLPDDQRQMELLRQLLVAVGVERQICGSKTEFDDCVDRLIEMSYEVTELFTNLNANKS